MENSVACTVRGDNHVIELLMTLDDEKQTQFMQVMDGANRHFIAV